MCMDLLGKLARSDLPLTEADPEVINKLRMLEAAGHIRVLIPPAHFDCDDCLRQDAATILEILPAGWQCLSASRIDESAALFPSSQSHRLTLSRIAAWFSAIRHRSDR
jgi:hypothetical protein